MKSTIWTKILPYSLSSVSDVVDLLVWNVLSPLLADHTDPGTSVEN